MRSPHLRNAVLEFLFWTSFVVVLLPLAGVFIVEHKLRQNSSEKELTSGWSLFDKDHQKLKDNFSLPQDLINYKELLDKNHWVYEKTVSSEIFSDFKRPTIVLGRIGDSDRVEINGCSIGSTGLTDNNEQRGWWWGFLSSYEIPKHCIQAEKIPIKIEIYHWGVANAGIYAGPLGIGEYTKVDRLLLLLDIFRYKIFTFFGALLLAAGVYYLFVYILVPAQVHNSAFALFVLSTGVYEIMVGMVPYRLSDTGTWPLRINFLSAVGAAVFFIWFLYLRFHIHVRNVYFISIGSVLFLLWGLPGNTFEKVFQGYQAWFPFFLLIFFISLFQVVRDGYRNRSVDSWRYVVGCSAFIICCLHDVIVSVIFVNSPYLVPYGSMLLLSTAALALAKEYADAFLHAEDLAATRTKSLETALSQLRSMEKEREEMVNIVLAENSQVAHDIRAPLAALDAILDVPSDTEEKKSLIRASISRIKGIADTLLDRNKVLRLLKETTADSEAKIKPQTLLPLIESVIAEQRVRLSKSTFIKLKTVYPPNIQSVRVAVNASQFSRVLSNLINNGAEALGKRGTIRVSVLTRKEKTEIRILDNGKGIPKDLLSSIGTMGFSHGKKNGSGLGIYHAQKVMKSCGGELVIRTREGKGTLVKLILLKAVLS